MKKASEQEGTHDSARAERSEQSSNKLLDNHPSIAGDDASRGLLATIQAIDSRLKRIEDQGKVNSSATNRLIGPQTLSHILKFLGRVVRTKHSDRSELPSLKQQRDTIEHSRLFDRNWYVAEYLDVELSQIDPITHYIVSGSAEGRDPSTGFSTKFYVETYPDVLLSSLNPLYHYAIVGRHQGRTPSNDAKYIASLNHREILESEFDHDFYCENLRVRLTREECIDHFIQRGWRERRDPHPQFSTKYYLDQNIDVWRAGINPYVHYLIAGRKEGRLPSQIQQLPADGITQWKLIAAEFDVPFYRARGHNIKIIEPVSHYLLEGWKCELDPNADFSTSHYLDVNPDVRVAGVNPFYHFLAEGRKEGRSTRQAGGWVGREQVRIAIEQLFDRDFYLAEYPDAIDPLVDPLDHYLDFGWREGRDPNADFSTSFYLESNPDVHAASINPFYHFSVAGSLEGRSPKHPGGWRTNMLQQIASRTSNDIEPRKVESAQLHLSHDQIASAIRHCAQSRLEKVILTISHDDYTASIGGVQQCLKIEEFNAVSNGFTYVNISPAYPAPRLSSEVEPSAMTLRILCNGELIGLAQADAFISAIGLLDAERSQFHLVVHSLIGHSPEVVDAMHTAFKPNSSLFWLHDFFSLCPSYALLRNGIAFCGAPHQESTGCQICVFGEQRLQHIPRVEWLFSRVNFDIISPSRFAADFWRSRSHLNARSVQVYPHCALDPATHQVRERKVGNGLGLIRVAFVGHPACHKGWEVFVRLLQQFSADGRYQFHHFGPDSRRDQRTTFQEVSVIRDGPNAMKDAILQKAIDIAILWSICPETFSFVAHEVIASGAKIATFRESGNIASLVMERGCGHVYDSEDEIVEAFRSGAIFDLCTNHSEPDHTVMGLNFSEMSVGVLRGAAQK